MAQHIENSDIEAEYHATMPCMDFFQERLSTFLVIGIMNKKQSKF
jgi:hypothetical protein